MADRLAAIAEAVVCLPTDICRLTNDYATERPHSWTPFETTSVTGPDAENGSWRINANDGKQMRLLVSSDTFATGHTKWTIEFYLSEKRWIGVGITASSSSSAIGDVNDLPDNWSICPCWQQRKMYVRHQKNWHLVCSFVVPDGRSQASFRIDFDADRILGSVFVAVYCNDTLLRRWILMDASTETHPRPTMPELASLRPFVAVNGLMQAVVRSGSDYSYSN
jgi:hypothetical protein